MAKFECATHGQFESNRQWGCPDCMREARIANSKLHDENIQLRDTIVRLRTEKAEMATTAAAKIVKLEKKLEAAKIEMDKVSAENHDLRVTIGEIRKLIKGEL